MALSEADIEAFIEALQRDVQLRDRVRNAILADDFLALPGIVRSIGEKIDALAARDEQLAARLEQLTAHIDQLTEDIRKLTSRVDVMAIVMERMDGRIGSLEGWRFEVDYRNNLATHLARRYRDVRMVTLGNYVPALKGLDGGTLSSDDWSDLARLDVVAEARRRNANGSPVLLAVELSVVVGESDVTRVDRRAGLLRRLGLEVDACVDGESILPEAGALAEKLGVVVLTSRQAA